MVQSENLNGALCVIITPKRKIWYGHIEDGTVKNVMVEHYKIRGNQHGRNRHSNF